MSDHWIVLIPDEPSWVPEIWRQQQAVALLQTIAPDADEVKATTADAIQFVDCGANFEAVFCPECGSQLEIEWWGMQLDAEAKAGFLFPPIPLPCCHAKVPLSRLRCEFAQGFARFTLEAMNSNIGRLPGYTRDEFERILGCKLTVIYRHI